MSTALYALLALGSLAAACYATPVGVYSQADGDFNIGLVLPIHRPNSTLRNAYDPRYACGELDTEQMLQATFFINMVQAINRRSDILPNVKLGYSIIDSCSLPNIALLRASGWTSYKIDATLNGAENVNITNEYCPVTFAVGGYNSRVSLPLTMFLELFDIPLIDSGATLGDLSDRRRYKLYSRTSPSDVNQAAALADVVKTLGHSCVHLVYSQGLYGEMGADDLRAKLIANNICIASDQMAPTVLTSKSSVEFGKIVQNFQNATTAKTVMCFCEDSTLEGLIASIKLERSKAAKLSGVEKPRFILIGGDYWTRQFPISGFEDVVEGAITTYIGLPPNRTTGVVFDADKLIDAVNSSTASPWLIEFFERKFGCSFTDPYFPCDLAQMPLSDEELPVNDGAELLYLSVVAGVQGLHQYLSNICPPGNFADPACVAKAKQNAATLHKHIISQTVDASEFGHPPFTFDASGEGQPRYTFFNIQEATIEDEEQSFSYPDYFPVAVWTSSIKTMELYNDAFDKAKLWPGTNETITSTCKC